MHIQGENVAQSRDRWSEEIFTTSRDYELHRDREVVLGMEGVRSRQLSNAGAVGLSDDRIQS